MSDRQRRYRRRQRRNMAVYQVEAGEHLLTALVAAGAITDSETDDRDRVAAAIGVLIERWAAAATK